MEMGSWHGGTSTHYDRWLKGRKWAEIRKNKYQKVLSRGSRPQCAFCGAAGEELHLHHLIYRPNLDHTRTNDLRVACRQCHVTIHKCMDEGWLRFPKDEEHDRRFFRAKSVLLWYYGHYTKTKHVRESKFRRHRVSQDQSRLEV